MDMVEEINCQYCCQILSKDEIGLNKKLFPMKSKRGSFMCISCMASFFECSIDDLKDRIEQFKNQGCVLF
jgi:hypothetical protein